MLILILVSNNIHSQANIFDREDKLITDIENNIIVNFSLAEYAFAEKLQDLPDSSYITMACSKSEGYLQPFSIIAFKSNKNLFYTFIVSVIQDKDGYPTENAYVGCITKQFGEPKRSLYKQKKKRLFIENNVFTEEISTGNGIILIIENKLYVRKIKFPNKKEIIIDSYLYSDCSN